MPRSLMDLAMEAHQSGDAEKAKRHYLGLLETEPKNVDVLHLLGILHGQQTEWDESVKYLEKAYELDPSSPQINNSLGNTLKNLKKTGEAISHFEKAIELEPKMFTAHNNLAILYSMEQQWNDAIDHYEKAIALKPDYDDAYFNLAMAYMNNNDKLNAIKYLQETIELKPEHPEANRQLGQICQQDKKFKEAIHHFKISLKHDQNHVDTLINLGASLMELGENDEAIDAFNQALKEDPKNYEAHYNAATTYLSKRNLEKALMHFLRVLDQKPSPEIYYNIGVIYMYQERHSDAIGFLTRVIELEKEYAEAYVNLAVCYLKIEDIPKAIKNYELAQQLQPDNKEIAFILNALTQNNTTDAPPKEFIQSLFDQYAPYFEQHLTEYLRYESPKKLYDAVMNVLGSERTGFVVLDLGCGTGLCGALFKHIASKLIGVDLASKMIKEAKSKHIYDEVMTNDVHDALEILKHNDIIIAGDVFSYIGDLDKLFSLAKAALTKDGIFAFTVEKQEDHLKGDYHLTQSARFTHRAEYIHRLAKQHSFTIKDKQEIVLREQKKQPLIGLLFVLSI